ncbi:MAG: AAA family ATPase, partial [Alistipes sp.]|nr:AAA family ATPase [Alistipes sp.]
LDIAMNHKATTSKDRTGLFTGKPEFVITPQVGQAILRWCNLSTNVQPQNSMPYVQHSSAA